MKNPVKDKTIELPWFQRDYSVGRGGSWEYNETYVVIGGPKDTPTRYGIRFPTHYGNNFLSFRIVRTK